MPANPPRRLIVPARSLYDSMAAEALHSLPWRRDIEDAERDRPELIVEREGNVLLADVAGYTGRLHYSFRSERDFAGLFPAMFETLVPRLRRASHVETVRFRLEHNPARPVIEPVLRKLWFSPSRDWLRFGIERPAVAAAPPGVRFRAATAADAEEMSGIDRECFPNTPMPVEFLVQRLRTGDSQGELAIARGEIVGYCTSSSPDPGSGFIDTLAVREAARGGGVGAALTARVLKRLLRGGAKSVALTTDQDNGPAIRLYQRLGFRQTRAGRDYSRPADTKAIARLKRENQGTLIKFGGWR
jgi:ribosomal protein S18 acetylase RimI-like enzyme